MSARQWFRFENAADDPTIAEIHIIDFIGGWIDDYIDRIFNEKTSVTARPFVEDLAKLPEAVKTIRVHINSPGGDVWGAVNIANALREQQSRGRVVETIVDGLAASAASIIAMAGTRVVMADNALMMIHNPWTVEIGEASVMRKTADTLDTVRGQIVATYQWHSELPDAEIAALMDAETWMNADEALANGFATDKVEGLKAAASIAPKAIAALKVPERYKARIAAFTRQPESPEPKPEPATASDVLAVCEAAGCLDLARGLLASNATLDQAQQKTATVKAEREAAKARETEIRALCEHAKLSPLADGYVRGTMAAADVRTHLATITAKLDSVEIDSGLNPDAGTQGPANAWDKVFDRIKRRGVGLTH